MVLHNNWFCSMNLFKILNSFLSSVELWIDSSPCSYKTKIQTEDEKEKTFQHELGQLNTQNKCSTNSFELVMKRSLNFNILTWRTNEINFVKKKKMKFQRKLKSATETETLKRQPLINTCYFCWRQIISIHWFINKSQHKKIQTRPSCRFTFYFILIAVSVDFQSISLMVFESCDSIVMEKLKKKNTETTKTKRISISFDLNLFVVILCHINNYFSLFSAICFVYFALTFGPESN